MEAETDRDQRKRRSHPAGEGTLVGEDGAVLGEVDSGRVVVSHALDRCGVVELAEAHQAGNAAL